MQFHLPRPSNSSSTMSGYNPSEICPTAFKYSLSPTSSQNSQIYSQATQAESLVDCGYSQSIQALDGSWLSSQTQSPYSSSASTTVGSSGSYNKYYSDFSQNYNNINDPKTPSKKPLSAYLSQNCPIENATIQSDPPFYSNNSPNSVSKHKQSSVSNRIQSLAIGIHGGPAHIPSIQSQQSHASYPNPSQLGSNSSLIGASMPRTPDRSSQMINVATTIPNRRDFTGNNSWVKTSSLMAGSQGAKNAQHAVENFVRSQQFHNSLEQNTVAIKSLTQISINGLNDITNLIKELLKNEAQKNHDVNKDTSDNVNQMNQVSDKIVEKIIENQRILQDLVERDKQRSDKDTQNSMIEATRSLGLSSAVQLLQQRTSDILEQIRISKEATLNAIEQQPPKLNVIIKQETSSLLKVFSEELRNMLADSMDDRTSRKQYLLERNGNVCDSGHNNNPSNHGYGNKRDQIEHVNDQNDFNPLQQSYPFPCSQPNETAKSSLPKDVHKIDQEVNSTLYTKAPSEITSPIHPTLTITDLIKERIKISQEESDYVSMHPQSKLVQMDKLEHESSMTVEREKAGIHEKQSTIAVNNTDSPNTETIDLVDSCSEVLSSHPLPPSGNTISNSTSALLYDQAPLCSVLSDISLNAIAPKDGIVTKRLTKGPVFSRKAKRVLSNMNWFGESEEIDVFAECETSNSESITATSWSSNESTNRLRDLVYLALPSDKTPTTSTKEKPLLTIQSDKSKCPSPLSSFASSNLNVPSGYCAISSLAPTKLQPNSSPAHHISQQNRAFLLQKVNTKLNVKMKPPQRVLRSSKSSLIPHSFDFTSNHSEELPIQNRPDEFLLSDKLFGFHSEPCEFPILIENSTSLLGKSESGQDDSSMAYMKNMRRKSHSLVKPHPESEVEKQTKTISDKSGIHPSKNGPPLKNGSSLEELEPMGISNVPTSRCISNRNKRVKKSTLLPKVTCK